MDPTIQEVDGLVDVFDCDLPVNFPAQLVAHVILDRSKCLSGNAQYGQR
jgi:hypothetical protein